MTCRILTCRTTFGIYSGTRAAMVKGDLDGPENRHPVDRRHVEPHDRLHEDLQGLRPLLCLLASANESSGRLPPRCPGKGHAAEPGGPLRPAILGDAPPAAASLARTSTDLR